jgi:RNA polymerase sigma-70 factor, ECF subfamily
MSATHCDSIGVLEVSAVDQGISQSGPSEPVLPQSAQWVALVDRIRTGDASAMQELYQIFGRGVRLYLCRQLGMQEVDDKIHDTFLVVVQAIRNGDLREPERLMGFVRTVARRMVAGHIDQLVHRRRDNVGLESGVVIPDCRITPEQETIQREKVDVMLQVLGEMTGRDRDILTRFYLYEQPQEQICREMKLTPTQFRLRKSRAKTRFAEMGRKKLDAKNTLRNFSVFLH